LDGVILIGGLALPPTPGLTVSFVTVRTKRLVRLIFAACASNVPVAYFRPLGVLLVAPYNAAMILVLALSNWAVWKLV
jgi:hypothetical protein